MAEQAPSTDVTSPRTSSAASKLPLLGSPASEARWLLPIGLCAGGIGLALPVALLIPLHSAVNVEPDPAIQAVLADQLFLIHLRFWPILVMAVLLGGAAAITGAQRISRALARLELRLRRIASGESDLPASDPGKEFAQFDEVFAALRAAIERSTKRNRTVLQSVQRPLRHLSNQLTSADVPRDELRKTLSTVLAEVDAVLDADRRAAAGRARL